MILFSGLAASRASSSKFISKPCPVSTSALFTTVRPACCTMVAKGSYTGCWMMTPSPGWLKARMAMLMPATTEGSWVTHAGDTSQLWRRFCQPHTAA